MVVYVDSSVLARAYLPDEDGHDLALALLSDVDRAVVTGSWTRVEVAGALVRASRHRRRSSAQLQRALRVLAADLGVDGPVTVVASAQVDVETRALELVVEHGLRAMDAWHLAVADLVARDLADRGEEIGFASRDREQSAVAAALGFVPL